MNRYRAMLACCLLPAVLWLLPAALAEEKKEEKQEAKPPAAAKPDQAALEAAFIEQLSGSVLVGHFTTDGRENKGGSPERYEIEKISKLRDNYWVFNSRVKYGDKDVTVPITLPIVWAGDTPMISMTDFTIPAMGTFTCRVFFYGDRYAGTWQHGKAGGHMYGKIEKLEAKEEGEKKE